MIEKKIDFKDESIPKLVKGCEKLAQAVTSTLGANGQTVIIEDQFGNPHVTKDGVTVANSIVLSDPVENLGVSILRQASRKTADEAGDGTTTSCALAMSMIEEIVKNKKKIKNVHQVKKGMDATAEKVVELLKELSREVTDESLEQVATISANGDQYLGKMIAEAYRKVGKNGVVTMEDSRTEEDYIDVVKGTRMKRGYGTPFSVNNMRANNVQYNNPLILLSDFKIDMHERLHFAFEASLKMKRPLLIISELDDRVKLFITQNINKKNLTANFITPEGIGLNKFELLQDLALMTGAKVISETSGDASQNINATYLGSCKQMISDINETILIFDESEEGESSSQMESDRQERIKWLEEKIKTAKKIERYHYEDRLSKLSGGIASIKVAAHSEVELKEKKDRVDDSIHATKAALEQGIVSGGGSALIQTLKKLRKEPKGVGQDFLVGRNIILESLTAPMEVMLYNSGYDYDRIDYIKASRLNSWGFDVIAGELCCMFDRGIVDPLKVTTNAVLNAKSVAATILTTSCVISNKRENSNESSR